MGRSRTFKYVVKVNIADLHSTGSEWRVAGSKLYGKGFGKPTAENLAKYVDGYMRSLEPGGSNAHIRSRDGSIPYPNSAKITVNGTGEVLAEWTAPMFMLVGPTA